MVDRWDNIEILQAIDDYQQETYRGGPLTGVNGLQLMERVAGSMVIDPPLWRGFVQELHIAADCGLLTFKIQPDPRPNVADADPHWYLQTLSEFALTVDGQDRARGRLVVQPRAMLETCGSAGKGVYLPGDLVEVSSKIGGATPVGKVQPDAHRSPRGLPRPAGREGWVAVAD